jgi:hypothetical protein
LQPYSQLLGLVKSSTQPTPSANAKTTYAATYQACFLNLFLSCAARFGHDISRAARPHSKSALAGLRTRWTDMG